MATNPHTSARLDPAMRAAIITAAKADGRSVSSLVKKIFAEWLERNDKTIARHNRRTKPKRKKAKAP